MSNLYTDADIKEIGLAFNAFDPAYISIVNNGTIERRYLKPLMNDFYSNFVADVGGFPNISEDVKRAIAYLVIDSCLARNAKSKTQNLGELSNFTRNSKTADSSVIEIKRDEFYTEAVMLLIDVATELMNNKDAYTDFDTEKAVLEITFRNTTGLV